jgi:phospholipase C
MDGFYTTDGINCLGYYTGQDLPFYYSLFGDYTLCANYFCPVMGPTYPNRFYLVAGTSGGITTNGIWGFGVFDYPIIPGAADAAGHGHRLAAADLVVDEGQPEVEDLHGRSTSGASGTRAPERRQI